MRSIPFKVICLVGMNGDDFPRDSRAPGFDLIARNPRPGDRSRRTDDKYLFLEAIVSARDRLYISYVGRNIEDNTPIPPSVPVSELLDYLRHGFGLDSGAIGDRTSAAGLFSGLFQQGPESCSATQGRTWRRPLLIWSRQASAPGALPFYGTRPSDGAMAANQPR